jgi:hypothetical protein
MSLPLPTFETQRPQKSFTSSQASQLGTQEKPSLLNDALFINAKRLTEKDNRIIQEHMQE